MSLLNSFLKFLVVKIEAGEISSDKELQNHLSDFYLEWSDLNEISHEEFYGELLETYPVHHLLSRELPIKTSIKLALGKLSESILEKALELSSIKNKKIS
jgi:hypothetical protein